MAGAGYKLFNTGDVLTAAQVNTYLQEQVVMVFANATSRTTALSGVLAEGMMSYLQDTNAVEVYNGSAWVSVGSTGDITGVTAGTGISGGGTSGDVTITNSMATAIDAKGDLIVGTGADTFDRLAVGTNGYTLVADSSTSTGLAWAAPAGGSLVGVSLYDTNVTQSINNNTYTALTWNSEDFDTDGFHSTSTNTSRITIPTGKGGKYRVEASTAWATNATGERVLVIRKNGSNVALNQTIGTTATAISNELSCVLVLAANDYIEAFVLQSSGGSLNAYKNDPDRYGWFSATYLGA